MSLSPRKTPCIANERRTAGAPSDLRVKYCTAGFSMGESYITEDSEHSFLLLKVVEKPRSKYFCIDLQI